MPAADRPNVLFFFTDDQRFDTIRALGNPAIHTPFLDSLVERGTAFTHAHIMGGTCGAVCMPSRAMLMTGRSLWGIDACGESINEKHVLLGETLQRAGYATYGIGKWHNGPDAYARSFGGGAEIFFGGMMDHWNVPACDYRPDGTYETTPYCADPMHSGEVKPRYADHVRCGVHSSELLADGAIECLDGHDPATPFFLYLSFLAPHDPRTMPKAFLDLYDPETIELPPNYMPAHPFDNGELRIRDEQLETWPRTPRAIRRHLAEYYAMISHADAEMARVWKAVEAKGMAENTIVVFAGDNGLALGRHGLMGKQSLYEHSVRVPLVLAGPGVPKGERRDAFCYLFDIYPTLCDMAGAKTPESVEGESFGPVLRGETTTHRESLYLGYRHVQRAVRERRWKLIEYAVPEGERVTQLFDLKADPDETRNLADDPAHAEEVARLRADLARQAQAWSDPGRRMEGETSFWERYAE